MQKRHAFFRIRRAFSYDVLLGSVFVVEAFIQKSRTRDQPGQASGKLGPLPRSWPTPYPSSTSFATAAVGPPHRSRTRTPLPPHRSAIMNAFRVARAARPAFNTLRAVQRRGYADVAADKIQLSLALPHQVRLGNLEDVSMEEREIRRVQ